MNPRWDMARLVVGLVLVAIAVLMLLFRDYATAGIAAIAVLGLISVATARRRQA